MGFLTLGNRFGNNVNDIIDDRIDLDRARARWA